jgi:hypothetical protein
MTRSLPTQTAMVRRITRAYRAASAADRAAGLGWYDAAQREAAAIWPERPDLAAGVLAALSPRCQWSSNVAWAHALVTEARAGRACPDVSTKANRRTAWAIATAGDDPLRHLGTVSHTGRVVSGHKVRAFYRNITGDHDSVTVDVWAFRAATGLEVENITARQYRLISAAYVRAAAILGITPRECQAAVWVATRGTKPTDAGWHAAIAA